MLAARTAAFGPSLRADSDEVRRWHTVGAGGGGGGEGCNLFDLFVLLSPLALAASEQRSEHAASEPGDDAAYKGWGSWGRGP